MSKKTGKRAPLALRILGGFLKTVLVIVLAAILIAANTLLPKYGRMLNEITGYKQAWKTPSNELDLNYNLADFTKKEMAAKGQELNEEIVGEGAVLLVNEDALPYEAGHSFSFFSQSSVNILAGGYTGGATTLKDAFESRGFTVNETLWKFYQGTAKTYKRGPGSINYGRAEDFSINECPVSELEGANLESSFSGTGVFVWSRVVGEGRDMPRSMVDHTDIAEDQTKSYLEPDSVELGILKYMDEHFEDVVILINSPAAMELGWINDFEHIHAVVSMGLPGTYGTNAIADIFAGNINPSGRTVDTYAYDAFSSPAAQNYGDYMYVDESGALTKYSYLSYAEGIYVGYRYYETRYEDAALGQGNAGDYDYDTEVQFPFGYGLSYTTFEWSDFDLTWDGDTASAFVTVTNTGDVAGKDVVQLYAQSPYTEYDRANGVEKSSVELVGYEKTPTLEPGESITVAVNFDKEQLKAYDENGAGTYIFDAGDYYITAGRNAHDAVNNILAAKDAAVDGNADMAVLYVPENTDTDVTTYATDSYTGTEIGNLFGDAAGEFTRLTRSDWTGTFPAHDGEVSSFPSTWGNEINGTDANGTPASFVYVKTATADEIAKMDSADSLSPVDPASFTDTPFSGRNNEYYSEDAFVSGTVASLSMRGAAEKGMYTFIKHFALNDQENHRGDGETEYGACTFASEQSIREIYVLPFEMCLKAEPVDQKYLASDGNGGYTVEVHEIRAAQAMMTAFNRLGFTWTGGCYPLITGLVRDEWAFEGFIITDADTPTHMDPYQMIEAGADGKLNYSAKYELDFKDPAVYHYSREAAHHILYTVANSKIMNGAMPGSTLTGSTTAVFALQSRKHCDKLLYIEEKAAGGFYFLKYRGSELIKEERKMKALFIGGTGTISMAIVRRLAEDPLWDVWVLNRGLRQPALPEGVHQIIADIKNEAETEKALGDMTFDVVCEFIGFTVEDVARDYRLFKGRTRQYMYTSSASAYNKPAAKYRITEGTTLANPYWEYSRNKAASEAFLMQKYQDEGFPVTIVRPSHTYDEKHIPLGIHGKNGFWQIIKRMLDGKPVIIHGDGSSLWTVTFNTDFAVGYTGLMGSRQAIGEAFQITNDESLTWDQIYQTIADALGVKLNAYHVSSDFLTAVGAANGFDFDGLLGDKAVSVVFDNTKLKALVPEMTTRVPFYRGVRIALDYILAHPECQVEDPEFDAFCDRVIAAQEQAKKLV